MALVGGQADDLAGQIRRRSGRWQLEIGIDPPPQNRRDVAGFAALGCPDCARGRCGRRMRWKNMGGGWGWPFKSPMICSTWAATKPPLGKRVGKDAERGKLTFPGLVGGRQRAAPRRTIDRRSLPPLAPLGRRPKVSLPWLAMFSKGTVDGPTAFENRITARPAELSLPSWNSWPREMRDVALQPGLEPHGPLRLEPGRGRALPGAAQDVRFQPRSADLGHRPSDLSAQD